MPEKMCGVKPIVSVIIPCYNASEYIRTCIQSVLDQNYRELEIICVDDGSTDDTVCVLEAIRKEDNRIHIVRQHHQYAGVARNNGMECAKGKYLMFLDCDDTFIPGMLLKAVTRADETDADVVLFDALFKNHATGEYTIPSYVLNKRIIEKFNQFSYQDIPDEIFQVALSVPWNKLVKKEFIQKFGIRFQGTKRSNDEYFSAMVLIHADRISWIAERLVIYSVENMKSLQGFADDEISEDFFGSHIVIKNRLIEEGLYEIVRNSYINKACSACVSQLKKQRTYQQFNSMYRFIKEKAVPGLLTVEERGLVINKSLKDILESANVSEYLFLQVKHSAAHRERYPFPFHRLKFDEKNIVLYGAGQMGQSFYRQLTGNQYYRIVGWYDQNYIQKQADGWAVSDPEELRSNRSYERIIIAINNRSTAEKVKDMLAAAYCIPKDKFITC